jgi:chaperonin cofactor prefoldin
LEGSLEALKKQPDERPVYRQMGPLLLEVEDRDELINELSTSIEKLQEHQQRLEKREQQLRERYEQVVEQFEGSA